MNKIRFLIIGLLILVSSCTYYSEEELYPDQVCDTSEITYSVDIQPIFEGNCYLCHSTSTPGGYYGNLNLEDFTNIQRVVENGKLLRNIKHEPDGIPMPKGGGKLSDCNIAKIENWINQGIPNN
jgi:hypothetical protein